MYKTEIKNNNYTQVAHPNDVLLFYLHTILRERGRFYAKSKRTDKSL